MPQTIDRVGFFEEVRIPGLPAPVNMLTREREGRKWDIELTGDDIRISLSKASLERLQHSSAYSQACEVVHVPKGNVAYWVSHNAIPAMLDASVPPPELGEPVETESEVSLRRCGKCGKLGHQSAACKAA